MPLDDKYKRDLPKWPQVIITGKKVTKEQALEIIRRTDAFFHYPSGNNREFVASATKILHLYESSDLFAWPGNYSPKCEQELYNTISNACWEYQKQWCKEWGYVHTQYITNDWISCSFIGGPHGWMHPDGTIDFTDNVGKWPAVSELYDDFETIATAFPFLEVEAIVMSGENYEDDTTPVVGFVVRDGKVQALEPSEVEAIKVEAGRYTEEQKVDELDIASRITHRFSFNKLNENTFDLDQIKAWYDQVFGKKDKDN